MEKNYYAEYYHLERSHWWFKARAHILMSHVEKISQGKKDLKILNVGAATGHSSELLTRFGEVTSLEYDKDCSDFVREKLKIPIINGSVLDLPFANDMFDLVCAFDVIEHVADDRLAVKEMRRVCKKGGLMCVTVPAFMFLWSEHDVVNHHFKRYTSKQLLHLFDKNDENLFQSYFNFWLFFPIAAFRLISKILPFKKKKTADQTASDFGVLRGGVINSFFYRLFKSENVFLKNGISLPIGVSILSTWRKM